MIVKIMITNIGNMIEHGEFINNTKGLDVGTMITDSASMAIAVGISI